MMKPERLDLKTIIKSGNSSEIFKRMVAKIRQESLFVYPTETIYGVGGVATPVVKKKIIYAKRRKPESPLILIAGDLKIFSGFELLFNKWAEKLVEAFWPGNMTLILPINNSKEKISIRISNHPLLQILAKYIDQPFYSTSANISGSEYVNDPDVIYNIFYNNIDMMIDDGVLPDSDPSTVVDVSCNDQVFIIREGAISSDKIYNILGEQR